MNHRPLVTLIIFSYNQECFIRDAIASAFSQTYQPLEIVLSDDNSSDTTYQIMQEMSSKYCGPHTIKLIKNDINIGVLPHVMLRGKEACGDIVVVAAGDDISRSNRVESLVELFQDPCVLIATSLVDIINENGFPIKKNVSRPLHEKEQKLYFKKNLTNIVSVQGCSAAYRKEIFSLSLPTEVMIFPEDLLFAFYAMACKRKIVKSDKSLVLYRQHQKALSNYIPRPLSRVEIEEKNAKMASIGAAMLEAFLLISSDLECLQLIDKKEINKDMFKFKMISSWQDKSVADRILGLIKSIAYFDLTTFVWGLLRVWGKSDLYQPRTYLGKMLSLLKSIK